MNEITQRVNDLFRKSLGFVDQQDLKREFSETQLKFGKELLKKDLSIQGVQSQIDEINSATKELNSNSDMIKNNLKSIQQTL